MDKSASIAKLKRQASEVGQLARADASFKQWQRNTELAIEHIFGTTTRHLNDFKSVDFTPSAYSMNNPEPAFVAAFNRGKESARAVLASMIEEIDEYWPEHAESELKPGLLARQKLRQALDQMPDLASFDTSNPAHIQWIGRTLALIRQVDSTEAFKFELAGQMAGIDLHKELNYAQMRSLLETMIAKLDLQNPEETQRVYGPGAQYDFYRDLKRIIEGAATSVFIVDPYINTELFDLYVEKIKNGTNVRLLTTKFDPSTEAVIKKYKAKPSINFQARQSSDIHDRVVIIDGIACWVLGQSIKDAATTKPTYIVPLPSDVVALKEAHYEKIWNAATTI